MRTIGMYMAIAGIASIALLFANMNLIILSWIDMWGDTIGWVIRIGLVVVGGILFFMGNAPEEEHTEGA